MSGVIGPMAACHVRINGMANAVHLNLGKLGVGSSKYVPKSITRKATQQYSTNHSREYPAHPYL